MPRIVGIKGTGPATSLDTSATGIDYGGGFSYEDYGTRYLDLLRELTGDS